MRRPSRRECSKYYCNLTFSLFFSALTLGPAYPTLISSLSSTLVVRPNSANGLMSSRSGHKHKVQNPSDLLEMSAQYMVCLDLLHRQHSASQKLIMKWRRISTNSLNNTKQLTTRKSCTWRSPCSRVFFVCSCAQIVQL